MKKLRRILIVFGWLIPPLAILGVFASIYSMNIIAGIKPEQLPGFKWQVLSGILGSVRSLALSPLCFFGAYMLKDHA